MTTDREPWVMVEAKSLYQWDEKSREFAVFSGK